jgi:hypothetical protein
MPSAGWCWPSAFGGRARHLAGCGVEADLRQQDNTVKRTKWGAMPWVVEGVAARTGPNVQMAAPTDTTWKTEQVTDTTVRAQLVANKAGRRRTLVERLWLPR